VPYGQQQNWKACWGNPQEFESLILRQCPEQPELQGQPQVWTGTPAAVCGIIRQGGPQAGACLFQIGGPDQRAALAARNETAVLADCWTLASWQH
jgi:hypothetical protein